MGRLKDSPFLVEAVRPLKKRIIRELGDSGFLLGRHEKDGADAPVDFRLMDQLMRAAPDPDRSIGKFARGVKVDPGVRLPRLPALHRPKRRWKLAGQGKPYDYMKEI